MIVRASSPRLAFRLLGARGGPRAAAALFRATGMFGKDLLHHAGIFLLMLGLPVFLLYVEPAIMYLQGKMLLPEGLRDSARTIYLVMLTGSAYVFGLVLTADEVESRTIPFLDTLPARPYSHFIRKLMTALLMLALWVVAEGLLLGVLSRQGGALLRDLVTDRPSLITRLSFGRGGALIFLQALSLVLTGMVSGCLYRNLAASAVAGLAGYMAWLLFVRNALIGPETPLVVADRRSILGLLVWCVLMVLVWPRAFRRTEFRRSDAAARVESSSPAWRRLTGLLNFRLHGLPFDPPNRYLLRVPLLLLTVISGAVSYALPQMTKAPELLYVWLLLLGSAVALAGSASWLPEERESGRFFLDALPTPRERIFWPRVITLLAGSLVLGTTAAFCFLTGVYLQAPSGLRTEMVTGIWPILPGVWIVGMVSVALLGSLFRLFFRNAFTPAVLALLTGGVWMVLSALTLDNAVTPGNLKGGNVVLPAAGAQIVQLLWNFLLPIVLSLLAGWLAFCRSRLLELPEKTRGALAVILVFVLLLWGGLLLTAAPAHLWTILAG